MRVIANIDGGSRGNPGPAAAGVVIRTQDDGTVLHVAGVYVGRATNNVAEYNGLLEALKRAAALGADEIEVLSDSELLVKQMNGEYRVRNAALKPLFEEANRLWNKFAKVTGFPLIKYKDYRLTFDAYADADRPIDTSIWENGHDVDGDAFTWST
ncbi:hypothetical protein LCGC14_2525560, partial [marine sediment metagenome]